MARADSNHTTKLSSLFRDTFVAAAFRRAEDDGLTGAPVDTSHPRHLDGGAAETARILEMA
ncbi:hypothetical protein HU675_0037290 [Bradyrhizobium septentrionale]|uniref:hypothetical protein n=1 Tax=Bradyrhizobium septentrionale TaxID=1404411 RepID=UPI001596D593|nr:hypothetical protein [Bradyrhizobium septentrionale]UGY23553.1 hypothetical protein HU675_0037290 [Bradyrhizobium septentrionale]